MRSKTLLAAIAAALLATGATLAIGAHATPAEPVAREAAEDTRPYARPHGRMAGHRGPAARRMMALHVAKTPELATIRDLRLLEGAYRRSGREKDVASIYHDVLKRTDNALVRDFANHRLARIAMRSGDSKGAIERLQQSLDEDLKRLK